ncbi:isocitrate lyase/PEP mutase family protein [Mucilaginibacter sp. FT3.2]|uniref:isocitrate lyase/PEP mutase family protein n=1 Tax=Mucilaginibacter sp. FT3.2 TaxID=2723090 RepID=UPI00161173AA|nr:isocitrate lyase/phosphoenolpyruvate mutase family protein [Mucilaginibacter sp. FT3.2]MBB6232352.1 2-methylisocitrate lyase-like PEP mutase family enzyme [Mucilaginibacter sp. FT3.2]
MNTSTAHLFEAKANEFKMLHQRPGIFVIPNPWDAGSARVLETLGFKALATTSAGLSFSLGKPDGHAAVTREETLAHIKSIVNATSLPVSADLENGYGDEPSMCAETIVLAASVGLSGGSIEDATGNHNNPIYPFEFAVERVKAAVKTVKELPYPFTLTARAENYLHGRPDLNDTIKRLEAFADAGADVLFAPGLKTRHEIETVVKALAPKPVNVIMGISGVDFSLAMLEDIGVKRVSIGSSLVRAAYGAFFRAVEEILHKGTFNYAAEAKPYADLNKLFSNFNK